MFRKIAVTTAAAATSLVIAATGAGAVPGSYVPSGIQQTNQGTGTATASISTDPYGRMTADSSAVGDSQKGLLGTKTKKSTASAEANVSDSFSVEEGRYRITVTYDGVAASETQAGSGSAEAQAESRAFFSPTYFEGKIVGRTDTDLDDAGSTLTQSFEVSVSKSGTLTLTAELQAYSTAKGQGNTATTSASTTAVTFDLQKVG